jgi:hypothetical protein
MLVHERFHTVEPFALTVRHVEVHWAFLTFLGENFGGTVSPQPVHRKTIIARVSAAAVAGVVSAGVAMRHAH